MKVVLLEVHRPLRFSIRSIAMVLIGILAGPAFAGNEPISYNRQIRPLLSEHCFRCHGPDSSARKAGLRLDQAESACAKLDSGATAIVPGDPDQSELIKRITATSDDDLMPPPKERKPLKRQEIELLQRWVRQGARYEVHWAFQKIASPTVPNAEGFQGWANNPIDAFTAERLAQEGLKPSPREERARLIRRVSLDLTGLPPSIDEVDAFATDTSQDAYEKVVDRLLASPHFGERMAVPWLDLARHSDTGGYHNDSFRTTWLWRDWVVNALNNNEPFDRFTIEQLAGDLLPDATIDNKIASGFMRNVMTSDEGGIIADEYLNIYIVDRVDTLGATWLGMTVACAQCHDHKYDPVTQRDFYSLYAFFHNVPEKGIDGVRDRNPEPRMPVPSPQQREQLARLDSDITSAATSLKEMEKSLDARQADWERQVAGQPQSAEPSGDLARFPLENDWHPTIGSDSGFDAKLIGGGSFGPGPAGYSFRPDGKGWIDCGQQFGFEKDQPFSVAAWISVGAAGGSPLGKMDTSANVRGWDIEFHGTRPSVHLIHTWPGEAIHIQAQDSLPADKPVHIAFSYDGSGKAAGLKLFINGALAKTNVLVDNLSGSIETPAPFSIGRRGGVAVPFHGTIRDLRVYRRALDGAEVAQLGGSAILSIASIPAAQRTPEQKQQLQSFFRESVATDYGKTQRRLEDLRKEKEQFERTVPNTMVMVEMDQPRDTFIKIRGQYDKNGEKVTANTPHFLPPLPAQPANGKRYTRLDLANWLVSPDQPLVARVEVNRLWATVFGTGLVKTLNDFGSQGEWPSHPDLLEWLAADFQRDWNIKRAIRQMVTSATYMQSSRVTSDLLERDSANRLLARGPRNRLDAEFVRDNALAAGGLLNLDIGGAPVFPAQPPGIWEVNELGGGSWKQQHDAGQYRRGLYVYQRRSTPYPSLLAFDAPSREVCTAIRARSSTPLQSLVLMNDPVYVEAARALAQRVMRDCPSDAPARLHRMWRLVLARPISDPELQILQQTLDRQVAKFTADKAAARALIAVGDLPRPSDVDVSELAAWTTVASVILNTNEAITN